MGKLDIDILLGELKKKLPIGFAEMSPEHKLHFLVVAADEIIAPEGTWILINADMPLSELLDIRAKQ